MSVFGSRQKTLNSVLTLVFSMSAVAPALAADLHINGGGGGGGSGSATNGGGGGGGYVGSVNTAAGKGGTPASPGTNGAGGNGGNAGGAVVTTFDGQINGIGGTGSGAGGANGQSGTANGNGGNGGTASVVSDSTASYGIMAVIGGSAGNSGTTGNSANGGSASYAHDNTDLTVNQLSVISGFGGNVSAGTATNGGIGGDAAFSSGGNVTVATANALFGAQTGGNGSGTGAAGHGGNTTVTIGGKLTTTTGTLTAFGGIGGSTSASTGAIGGDTSLTVGAMDIAGVANIRGGFNFGNGDAGSVTVQFTDAAATSVFRNNLNISPSGGSDGTAIGVGGKGGSVTWNNPGTMQVVGDLAVTGGAGGAVANGHNGGAGGDVVFNVGTLELTSANNQFKTQALNGAGGGTLTANITTLRSINDGAALTVSKAAGDGQINFQAGTVEAVNNSLALSFSGTDITAGDTAQIGNLLIGGGKTLTLAIPANAASLSGGMTVQAYAGTDLETLVPATYSGTGAAALNFSGKNLNFIFPQNVANADTVLMTTSPLVIDNSTRVNLTLVGSNGPRLNDGDHVVLVSDITGSTYDPKAMVVQGSAYKYDFSVLSQTNQLIATFNGRSFDPPPAQNMLEGKTGGAVLTGGGTDTIVRALDNTGAMTSLYTSPGRGGENSGGNLPYSCVAQSPRAISFLEFGAESYQYKIGSDVNSDNTHLLAGPGLRLGNDKGCATIGAFFEAGWGNFDANNAADGVNYHGDGDTRYYGGGLLARYNLASGLYAEASARAGTVKTEYNARWTTSHYDSTSAYYGGHLGLGSLLAATENGWLDLSARMLWTHIDGDRIRNSNDEVVDFASTESLRSQLGGAYHYRLSEKTSVFAGAFWEYEFHGTSDGTLDGFDIQEVSLKGSSGIGRIGLDYQATPNFAVSLIGQGVVGKRQGGGGFVNLLYRF